MERHYYNILMRKLLLELYFINILRIFQKLHLFLLANTESSTATWACNTQLGLPNDEIEILSSGS